jgi:hypothetical protein
LLALRTDLNAFMLAEGWEFLSNLNETIFMETLFNAKPEFHSPIQFNGVYRAFRGITLAKICNQPYLDALAKDYRQSLLLVGAAPMFLEKFDMLYQYLKGYSFS